MQTLTFAPCQLPVSAKLHELMNKQLHERVVSPEVNAITINFRDKSYNAEDGGFHPVEIMIKRTQGETWKFVYFTDFYYVGGQFPELERNLDFDLSIDEFFVADMGWHSLKKKDIANAIYNMWETNFISYFDMGVFDEIEITEIKER
ncbi:DUF2787 domain-containing protein [Vibrio cholerae]|uniref:DUF2787 domain-containing protein n=1 Tax=Vibrio cholerae TaxID=666 RepID=UPI0011D9817E|nr:DUF2787 domain-containing protein [Vibrio cholerae]TXY78000.1 DUF2787 domain-containing protein [Vibrio cholerae]GIB16819.1 hypothetical protein VCSRO90_2824 [Vibrio cholerae]